MTEETRTLTRKQQVFVDEYLKTWNAAEAARRAGYSEKTAYSSGPRLLRNVEISAAISERLSASHMSADEVLTRLADIARGDLADFMEATTMGFSLSLTETDDEGHIVPKPNTKLIRKIKQKTTTFLSKSESGEDREVHDIEIELYSAKEALELIGKHHKLFNEPGSKENPLHVEGLEKLLDKVWSQPSKPTNE